MKARIAAQHLIEYNVINHEHVCKTLSHARPTAGTTLLVRSDFFRPRSSSPFLCAACTSCSRKLFEWFAQTMAVGEGELSTVPSYISSDIKYCMRMHRFSKFNRHLYARINPSICAKCGTRVSGCAATAKDDEVNPVVLFAASIAPVSVYTHLFSPFLVYFIQFMSCRRHTDDYHERDALALTYPCTSAGSIGNLKSSKLLQNSRLHWRAMSASVCAIGAHRIHDNVFNSTTVYP